MKNAKKVLTLLLALLMLVSPLILAACGDDTDGDESSTAANNNSGDDAGDALVPHLGTTDKYKGKTLRVLMADEENKIYMKEPFLPSENNAERVNEACIQRLDLLEEKYGIAVETKLSDPWEGLANQVRKEVTAGAAEYDVLVNGVYWMTPLASEGYLLDLNSIENSNLQLDKPWWDTVAHDALSIQNKLFFATGDILIMDDEYTYAVFYNKDIVENYQLDDPSALVANNEWTLDKMYEMAVEAAGDGGDGKMDVTTGDTWGIVCATFDIYNLTAGCNTQIVYKNEKDEPVFGFANERNVRAFQSVRDILTDGTVTAKTEDFYAWNDPEAPTVLKQFTNGNALFKVHNIYTVNDEDMRSADIRYGILPLPKYDSSQEVYANPVNPYAFAVVAILEDCDDVDFVTFALEAMAYVGEQVVTPEYYENTLENKRFPDAEDAPEMLELIFSNRLVDVAVAFDWDGCIFYYQNVIWNSTDVASFAEKKRGSFEAAMQLTMDGINGIYVPSDESSEAAA